MTAITDARLSEILPANLLADEKVKALALGIDGELEKLSEEIEQVIHLPRLDELSGGILDLLAWQVHVDFYEPLWLTDVTKRNLIRNSIAWHRQKGTRAAVEKINEAFGREITIREWFEYSGQPYHFNLTTRPFNDSADLNSWLRQLNDAKNVRSWCDVTFEARIETPLYVGIGRWRHGRIRRRMTANYNVGRVTTTLIDGTRSLSISASQVIIRYGDQQEVIDIAQVLNDTLNLRFSFPSSERVINLPNPREDLTPEEVQEVADYVIENQILLNDDGEEVQDIKRATLYNTVVQVLF